MALVTCPVCRAIIDNSASQCPICQYRPGSWPDALLPTFGLGLTNYTFQSARGVDYDFRVHQAKGPTSFSLTFTAPGGSELMISVFRGIGEPAPWNLYVWLDDVDLTAHGSIQRASEFSSPLREVLAAAITDINIESEAKRFRAYAGISAGGWQIPIEETSPDRLRSDFDLGPGDYEFDSVRGWHYEFEAETTNELASVGFKAPSGSVVAIAFEMMNTGARRDTRLMLSLDGTLVTERRALLSVAQFPQQVQWLISSAVADLNAESERRKIHREAAIARAAFHEP